jgi:hypothetical protein
MEESYRNFLVAFSPREEARLRGGPADGRVEEVLVSPPPTTERGAPFEGSKHHYVRTNQQDEKGRPIYQYNADGQT